MAPGVTSARVGEFLLEAAAGPLWPPAVATDFPAHKASNIHYLTLYRKRFPPPGSSLSHLKRSGGIFLNKSCSLKINFAICRVANQNK